MTAYYCKSGASNGDGLSWANAKTTLAAALALMTAGDTCYVSNHHSETTAASVNLPVPGTDASPCFVMCVDDSAEPPTALATGAVVACTGSTASLFIGSTSQGYTYWYGIDFRCGTGTNVSTIYLGSTVGESANFFDNCTLRLLGASGTYIYSGSVSAYNKMKNCWVQFSSTSQRFGMRGYTEWDGGGLLAGGTNPAAFFYITNAGNAKNLDLSAADAGIDVIDPSTSSDLFECWNTKMPAGWSGAHLWQQPDVGSRLSFYNVGAGADDNGVRVETIHGSIMGEETIVRTGGASDGTTAISWKVDTNVSPNAGKFPMQALLTDQILKWNDVVGSAVTATVEILRDSVTNLKNNEVWLEVSYQKEASSPLGGTATDAAADVFATAADQDTSSAAWTTSGMSNPNKQKLVVSFTPQQKGYIRARVTVAINNATLYVDPVLTLS